MLLESDILRLFFTGPYLVSSPLCSVSGVDCPSILPRQLLFCCLPLCSPATNCLSFPTTNCLSLGRVVNSHSRVPLPLPDTARFHVQESFVWFRAKTDSSALAACPHSATHLAGSIEFLTKRSKSNCFFQSIKKTDFISRVVSYLIRKHFSLKQFFRCSFQCQCVCLHISMYSPAHSRKLDKCLYTCILKNIHHQYFYGERERERARPLLIIF